MVKTLSPRQYWNFMLRNLPLVTDTGDTAHAIAAATTFVERADILAPYLKRIAPAADELAAIISGNVQVKSSPEALKRQILEAIAAEPSPRGLSRMVDGKWLEGGRKFFMQFVLPLIIAQLQEQLLGNRAAPPALEA